MNTSKTFDIYVIRDVPYIVSAILVLAMLSGLYLFLGYGFNFYDDTNEVAFYFLNALNDPLRPFIFAAALLVISYPLYKITRRKKRGRLIFGENNIDIVRLKEKRSFPLSAIKKVVCRDPENKHGLPNKKFGVRIETTDGQTINIRLKRSADIRAFTMVLQSYGTLNVQYSLRILWD